MLFVRVIASLVNRVKYSTAQCEIVCVRLIGREDLMVAKRWAPHRQGAVFLIKEAFAGQAALQKNALFRHFRGALPAVFGV